MTAIYQQKPDIYFRQSDGECFLADGEKNTLFNLNALGAAIWRVLVDPMTIDDVVSLFAEAFPDTDADTIRADVLSLFDDMIKAGIIVETVAKDE